MSFARFSPRTLRPLIGLFALALAVSVPVSAVGTHQTSGAESTSALVGTDRAPVAVSLTSKVGPPTSSTTVKGSGYANGESVNLTFDSAVLKTVSANASGAFSAKVAIPATAKPGTHLIHAKGVRSGRSKAAAFLVRTDWAQFHYGPTNTGNNPYENVVTSTNVKKLKQGWARQTGHVISYSSPAIAGGVVYVASWDGKLYAFTPKGRPLWTSISMGSTGASPTVSGGFVYVAGPTKVYAYSAKGSKKYCDGRPKVCDPVWSAPVQGGKTPTVAGGILYVGSTDWNMYAFSAKGTKKCGDKPKVCKPLWTSPTGGYAGTSPAVAKGVVYINSADGKMYAFSAKGTTKCKGKKNKTCKPLWTTQTSDAGTSDLSNATAPTVVGKVVYGVGRHMYAFSATGKKGCSSVPKVCEPLWTYPLSFGSVTTAAVANGVIYIDNGQLQAFSAAGTTNCGGTPKTCTPLWTNAVDGYANQGSSPAVANGVVYVGDNSGLLQAYSAAGTKKCSDAPVICEPLWTSSSLGIISSSPAVADGKVYVGANDHALHMFQLGN